MKQLKPIVFVLIVVFSLFACKKNRSGTPKKLCYGSFIAVKPLSWDSGVVTKIDENGVPEIHNEFPIVRTYDYTYQCMCYNKKDSCLYYLGGDDITEDIYLYKCNLTTKQTEKFTCSNSSNVDYVPNIWNLYYNSFTNKFYLIYSYPGIPGYVRDIFELTITDTTFSADRVSIPGVYPSRITPHFIDDQTGDMYFSATCSDCFLRYSPITGDTATMFVSGNISIYDPVLNPNDGKVYGHNSTQLVRLDLKTGTLAAFGSFNVNTDTITGRTFDECNNQYIVYTNSNSVNIYWFDAESGALVKKVATQNKYYSLIHIPQTQ